MHPKAATDSDVVRVRGIEPRSRVWKTRILTAVLHPRVLTYGFVSFCGHIRKSFDLCLRSSSQNCTQSLRFLDRNFVEQYRLYQMRLVLVPASIIKVGYCARIFLDNNLQASTFNICRAWGVGEAGISSAWAVKAQFVLS